MNMEKSVLIVEDDRSISDTLKELLESESYVVYLAGNGQEGISILVSLPKPPSFILLDLYMPVMDGKGFLRELRSQFPVLSGIPILMMTAASPSDYPTDFDRKKILKKPIDIDELFRIIDEIFLEA